MIFRWTYTPIAMLLIRVALAQTTFIESDSSFKCQLTIIGESHFLGNLHGPIERFVASRTMKGLGTDTLNYFVELPPSAAYFLWAYINHGDSMIYRNPILKYNYLDFLRKDGGEIEHIGGVVQFFAILLKSQYLRVIVPQNLHVLPPISII